MRDEVHLQGTFKTDYEQNFHEITFTLTKESYVRAYVAPLEFDVDLWLYLPDTHAVPIVRVCVSMCVRVDVGHVLCVYAFD